MITIDKETIISAPLENVFAYVSKLSNLPEIWPSLIQVKNEQLLPNGNYSFQWVYKMAGVYLEGTGEHSTAANQWITTTTSGAIDSTITWTFRSTEDRTRVTFTIKYGTPLPVLDRLGEMIIKKMNDQEADLILANLRARFMEPYVSR